MFSKYSHTQVHPTANIEDPYYQKLELLDYTDMQYFYKTLLMTSRPVSQWPWDQRVLVECGSLLINSSPLGPY